MEEDDDIIRERPPIDTDQVINMFENYINDNNETVHVVDTYANEYYTGESEVDNTFFEDSLVATQEDLNNIIMIPTPKHTNHTKLTPVVLLKIKAINGVPVSRPLIALCDTCSTGTFIKDSSLPLSCKPVITDHVTVSTTTQGKHECNVTTFLEHIQLPEFVNGRSIEGLQANTFHSSS